MSGQASPAAWRTNWRVPLPHSTRGRVLVAIRFIAVLALFTVAITTPGFFTAVSLFSLLNTTSFIGCVAVGMTFITLSGNLMSFALGVTLSTSGIVFIAALPLGVAGAMIVAFAFGAALTGVQGFVIGYFRANPIIVTIGAGAIQEGIIGWLSPGDITPPAGASIGFLARTIFGFGAPDEITLAMSDRCIFPVGFVLSFHSGRLVLPLIRRA